MTVGIREFKAHLSHYVRKVKKGETLVLTEHGEKVATLMPVAQSKGEDAMWNLARQGIIRWSGGKPTGLNPRIPCRGKPASQMVIEDREDRVK